MHPELKQKIQKLRLMKILHTNPDIIFEEGQKFFCIRCEQNIAHFCCPNRLNSKNIVFDFYMYPPHLIFEIYDCWEPRKK